ncbi:hypothetical protein N803_03535 [Knoellia subterranea KCTC 19937]|uniref:Uncharacterized protein n=1 Tax=Knoellia subterranea KCTC 19937 TaxID=1385521 RepID=A0A0A0JU83_9MICO|nr:hypothetical protein N803_03535 [Knoellia subterranea KCTC 19937]
MTVADRSKFVGLKVAGFPVITSTVAPNATIEILGVASVTFHKSVRTTRGLEVVMLEIRLAKTIAGLPTGTLVQVAGANAAVRG